MEKQEKTEKQENKPTMCSIETEVFEKCSQFALNSFESSLEMYARRNQINPEKIKSDIRNGKVAEEIVYSLLAPYLYNLSTPDYQIYQIENKSWDPDLFNTQIQISVKSQDKISAGGFGMSWVFSKYDQMLTNPNHKEYAAFVLLDLERSMGVLKAVVSLRWLKDHNLFKPLRKANLTSKVAVYYEDLKQFPHDQLWQL